MINAVGEKFGRLLVIEELERRIEPSGRKIRQCKCQCDCGKVLNVIYKSLKTGNTKSCGCWKIDSIKSRRGINNPCWRGYNEISGAFWSETKRNALRRKIDFDLSIKEAYKLFQQQNAKCALSGIDLQIGNLLYHTSPNFIRGNASIDRIDSYQGYHIKNIQWVDKQVNRIKQELSQDDFLHWCLLIYDHVFYNISHSSFNKNFDIKIKKDKRCKGYGGITGKRWYLFRQSAQVRNLEFDINIKDGWDLFVKQNGNCKLSGVDLFISNGKYGAKNFVPGNASLDRVNPNKSYTIDNIQWVHKTVNHIKNTLDNNDFLDLIYKIGVYQNSLT